MNKHTIISFILFVIISLNVDAQRWGVPNLKYYDNEPFHFGFLLGINQMDFRVKQNLSSLDNTNQKVDFSDNATTPKVTSTVLHSVLPSPGVGFTIGLVSSYRLTNNFNLRFTPSLLFGDRSLIYSFASLDVLTNPTNPSTIITIKSDIPNTLVELPLILRFSGKRIQNARPFIETGLKYVMNINSTGNWKNTIDDSHQNLSFSEMDKILNLKKSDIYGVLGVGFDFYFDYFKMGVEGTMNYGLNDILIKSTPSTTYENGITSLKSKVFQLSITFE